MEFSNHAKLKLSFYQLSEMEIESARKNALLECDDVFESSKVTIIKIDDNIFVIVTSIETNKVITIYKTDFETIKNRREKGRWICK